MVTRNIKANASTQVNGTNIGLEIATHKVTSECGFDFVRNQIYISRGADNNNPSSTQIGVDSTDRYWYATGNNVTVSDVTYYEIVTDNMVPQQTAYIIVDTLAADTPIYSITGEVGSEVITHIDTIQRLFSNMSGYCIDAGDILDENGDPTGERLYVAYTKNTYYAANPSTDTYAKKIFPLEEGEEQYVDGKLFVDDTKTQTNSGQQLVDPEEGDEYTEWTWEYAVMPDNNEIYVTGSNPQVGDMGYVGFGGKTEVPYLNGYIVYYPGLNITSIETDDVRPESVTVEYSVTGDTWQQHETILTDPVNFIFNIPKYLYLRFSEDVIITEE